MDNIVSKVFDKFIELLSKKTGQSKDSLLNLFNSFTDNTLKSEKSNIKMEEEPKKEENLKSKTYCNENYIIDETIVEIDKSTDTLKNEISTNIFCPEGVIDGCLYTKEKRHELYGRVSGGSGSKKPEDSQRKYIELGTSRPCIQTQIRINWRNNEMVEKSQPMRKDDGFDYTENFDGKQVFSSNTILINMKSVVGTGGSQTRTLRNECYQFVNAQLCYLIKSKNTKYYFANIFDGDEASSKMKMFHYLLERPEFYKVKKYIYVGDLKGYFSWIKTNICLSNK